MNSTISYKFELGIMQTDEYTGDGDLVLEPCWILYEYLHYAGELRSKVALATLAVENGPGELQQPALELFAKMCGDPGKLNANSAFEEGELPEVNFKLC